MFYDDMSSGTAGLMLWLLLRVMVQLWVVLLRLMMVQL